MRVPPGLEKQRRLGPDWAAWLDRLPRLADDLLTEWHLRVEGEPLHGYASLVLPVIGPGGVDAPGPGGVDARAGGAAMLKIGFDGSPETAQEHLALQAWAGDGAVRMYRADPGRRALLLERLHPRDLSEEWDVAACEIIAGLYPRLHRPAPGRLRPLTGFLAGWLDALAVDARNVPVPRRLIDRTLARGREFLDDPETVGRIIHGDLHYGNVLAADREPWLAIDPQPMSGDPHYEVAPLLWNRWDEMEGYLRGSIQTRFHAVIGAAGLDEDRARDWVIVRMVLNAHWAVDDARRMHRALDAGERDWITRCIAVAKAVQR